MRPVAALPLLCAIVTLSACGPAPTDSSTSFPGEKAKVAKTIEDFSAATLKRDQTKLCRYLTVRSAKLVQDRRRKPCADALQDLVGAATDRGLTVQTVTITGDAAKATVTVPNAEKSDRGTLTLRREAGAWKIDLTGR